MELYPAGQRVPCSSNSGAHRRRGGIQDISGQQCTEQGIPVLRRCRQGFQHRADQLGALVSSAVQYCPDDAGILTIRFCALRLRDQELCRCRVYFLLCKDAAQQSREGQIFLCTGLGTSKAQRMSAEMRQCMGIHPLCTEISGQRCRVFAQRRQPERKILFRHRREMTGADIDLLQHKVLGQNFHRAVVQAVQEGFNAGDDTHIGKVLVHFDLQVGLIPHFLLEQMGQHGIRAAAVVGQIHRIQVWVMGDELCAGQDVLSERIIQIFVFVRNVQRMTG